jgi:hypothetical protein
MTLVFCKNCGIRIRRCEYTKCGWTHYYNPSELNGVALCTKPAPREELLDGEHQSYCQV